MFFIFQWLICVSSFSIAALYYSFRILDTYKITITLVTLGLALPSFFFFSFLFVFANHMMRAGGVQAVRVL